jgi:hypothetical protein
MFIDWQQATGSGQQDHNINLLPVARSLLPKDLQ